jgi:L-serine dehydratase
MAAGAAGFLLGGSGAQIGVAISIVFKNTLGLVCDPVAGLVEVPCIKRNGACALQAIWAAELALAGVPALSRWTKPLMPWDRVGSQLPCALKETAQGGMAATPTAIAWARQILWRQS